MIGRKDLNNTKEKSKIYLQVKGESKHKHCNVRKRNPPEEVLDRGGMALVEVVRINLGGETG